MKVKKTKKEIVKNDTYSIDGENKGELIELLNLINQFFLIYGEKYAENNELDNKIKHIRCKNTGGIVNHILVKFSEKSVYISAPIPQKDKTQEKLLEYIEKGYIYFFIDGSEKKLHHWQLASLNPEILSFDMVIRKLNLAEDYAETIQSVVETALVYGDNKIKVHEPDEELFTIYEIVATHNYDNDPNLSSKVEINNWIPDFNKDIYSGGILPLGKFKDSILFEVIDELCRSVNKSLKTPIKEFPSGFISYIINGPSSCMENGEFFYFRGLSSLLKDTIFSKSLLSHNDYHIYNTSRYKVFNKSLNEILRWIKSIPSNYNGKEDFIKMKEKIEYGLNSIIGRTSLPLSVKYKIEDIYPQVNKKQNGENASGNLLMISFVNSHFELNHPDLIVYQMPVLENLIYDIGVGMALMAGTPELTDKSTILTNYRQYRQIDYERMTNSIFKEILPLIFNENPPEITEFILPESYITWLNLNSDVNLVKIGKSLRERGGKIKICPKEIYEESVTQSFQEELENLIKKFKIKNFTIDSNIPEEQGVIEKFIIEKFVNLNFHEFNDEEIQSFIGDCHWDLGRYDTALPYYLFAAGKGIGKANIRMGYAYHYGIGTDRDEKKALKYYRKALEYGFMSIKPVIDYLSGDAAALKKEKSIYSHVVSSKITEEDNLSFDVEETGYDSSLDYETNKETDNNNPFDV